MFAYDFTRYFDVRGMGIVTETKSSNCHSEHSEGLFLERSEKSIQWLKHSFEILRYAQNDRRIF